MVDIIHRVGIKAPTSKVYAALSTIEGIAGWWTKETSGSSKSGEQSWFVSLTNLIDAGLVDELRLIVYPLIAGEGKALFATTERRHGLHLRQVQQLQDNRVGLIYGTDYRADSRQECS